MKIYENDQTVLHHGDCLKVLSGLPECSVNCAVTSPPYYGLVAKQFNRKFIGIDLNRDYLDLAISRINS